MALLGIGTDVVDVRRFDRTLERWGERFLRRIFTEKELKGLMGSRRERESLAGAFAAKESFIKALGGRWCLSWRDIEVLKDRRGRPTLTFNPSKVPFPVGSVHVSISHDGGYALATCVVEEGDEGC